MQSIRQLENGCTNSHLSSTRTFLDNKYAILILAAGSSERLGRPKQLVKWNQTTLLNHTIQEALSSKNTDLYVALGGNLTDVRSSISDEITTIQISNWQDGMGQSISESLNQIPIQKYEAVIISTCDQPFISKSIFEQLINTFESKDSSIIISKYENSYGPPTLFGKSHFESLKSLTGDNGGKKIVRKHFDEVSHIDFKKGDIDIDTEEDVKNLSSL